MPSPIAIFYHTFPSGPGVAIDHGLSIVGEQLNALEESGLLAEAKEFHIGVSGGDANVCAVSTLAPDKARIIPHGPETCAELPTLCALQDWLPEHQGWHVLYLHTKGALYQGHPLWAAWRHCMAGVVIQDWQKCVRDMEQGFDTVGAHWMSPAVYGPIIGEHCYFGGNFWWATSGYLSKLPKLSPNGPSRWEAEVWLGRTKDKIRFRDYKPHWPMTACG